MSNEITLLQEAARKAKAASFQLAALPEAVRNQALHEIASRLADPAQGRLIDEANRQDREQAQADNLNQALLKRLALDEKKRQALCQGLKDLAALPDPLGRVSLRRKLDEGLVLERKSVPLGLVGVIFESRPDALVQIASLCLKSGNALILKGGKEALHTNRALHRLITESIESCNPAFRDSVILAETREEINSLLKLDNYIDLMIPRGSNQLVQYIKANTNIPVLGHADGICHLYIDNKADKKLAYEVTRDSKCQYPAVCNALETLLIHQQAAETLLPEIARRLEEEDGVELRGDERARQIYPMKTAAAEDWSTEYNDLILSIKIVDSLDEAIDHINTYGSRHTDAIVSSSQKNLSRFKNLVDSSSVMLNASTRFADGFRYGLGAEVGISTSKIHARGPVGLEGLTIYKYILTGQGHIAAPYAEGTKSFTHKDR